MFLSRSVNCRRSALAGAVTVILLTIGAAGPAAACGGLIGENGSIRLVRTTTLAGWHDGVEHYVTSFEFSGTGKAVGSIIPLPGVPTSVEAAGKWTLQRLQREVSPPVLRAAEGADSLSAQSATVLLTTEVGALNITVLKGGGDEVGKWALDNGFFLTPDAPEVLDFYAQRSPIFLAAKFDAERAAAQGLNGGDGTPIDITIPLDRPWVPLRILGLGLPATNQVQADVFLLTDDRPTVLTGSGIGIERSEPASASLMNDLRSDRNTTWMPQNMWLTHLVLNDTAGNLKYDLSAGVEGRAPSPTAAGYRDIKPLEVPGSAWGLETYLAMVGGVLLAGTVVGFGRRAVLRRA